MISMSNVNFIVPQNILFGENRIKYLPELIRKISAKNAFILSDRGVEGAGLVQEVENICINANIKTSVFLDIEPNPTVEIFEMALKAFLKSGAETVIALGGGSTLDIAKAIGVVAKFGGSVTDYEGVDKVPGEILPMIAIPTTAGTGSEVTPACVITDSKRNYKFTIFSQKATFKYVLLDPHMISSVPFFVAASTGIDAFIHAMEAYLSKKSSPFSDAFAEKAMELIAGNIRRFVADRKNKNAAAAMLVGSTLAGISFSYARLGNIHAMSHPVSAYFNVSHGVANAALMTTILEYNKLSDNGRYERIYGFLNREKTDSIKKFVPEMLIEEMEKLLRDLEIPASLAEVRQIKDISGKIPDKVLKAMVNDAMKSGNILVNPRTSTSADIEKLYLKALRRC